MASPPTELLDRLVARLPGWLAWPMSALATLLALGGAVLVFLAAVFGSISAAVWSAAAFVVAAIAWHLADYADANG